MKPLLILALTAGAAQAQPAPGPVTRPISVHERTMSGQPLALPQGPVRASVAETTLAAGGRLPPHKHPYPRYAYVLEGRLKVTNLETGAVTELKAGDFGIDAVDQWHEAVALERVRLLVVDQAPPGVANMIARAP